MIHLKYVIGILGGIILFLVTNQFSENANVTNYINFGATLTSLFLALIAIIYSFYSNSALSNYLTQFSMSSNEIKESVKDLASITSNLGEKVQTIPDLMQTVGNKITSTHDLLLGLKDKAEPIPTQKVVFDFSKELVIEFLKQCSFGGMFLLFVLVTSSNKNKAFLIDEVAKDVLILEKDYVFGFLAALKAAGLLSITISKDILTVVSVNDHMKVEIVQVIRERIERIKNPDMKSRLEEIYSNIQGYFQ